jgi:hypothetical protein
MLKSANPTEIDFALRYLLTYIAFERVGCRRAFPYHGSPPKNSRLCRILISRICKVQNNWDVLWALPCSLGLSGFILASPLR